VTETHAETVHSRRDGSRIYQWLKTVQPCTGSLSLCDSNSRTGHPFILLEIQSRRNGSPLPAWQFSEFPVIPHHSHASPLGVCLQALQGFDERDLPFLPRSPHVGNTSKHLNIAVAINDFRLHLMPCKALQAVKQLLGCTTIMLVKPRDGRFAAQGSMPSHRVSIMGFQEQPPENLR
jgi:hypothetical protein